MVTKNEFSETLKLFILITESSASLMYDVRKPIRAIHFLEICDWFVLDIEFVFKIE